MPLIRVELFDYRMYDETSAALIEKLTDALCEATHPGLRDHTWVIVEGHNPKNWGLGGKPWPVDAMPPAPGSLGSRARGEETRMPVIEVKLYDRRVTEESVPKMIEALTNALHESSGAAKEHIQVIIQGVPPKHWGQGGKPGEQLAARVDETGTASSSSTGAAPGCTACVSRAWRSVVFTISFARAKLSSSVGTGPTRWPSA